MQPLDRVEVLFKGRVVHTSREPNSSGRWRIRFTIEVGESGWFVARCFERAGSTIRFAHTSPIYLRFDGDAGVWRRMQQFLKWIEREIAFYRQNQVSGTRPPGRDDRPFRRRGCV
jgi:hypothetical protein